MPKISFYRDDKLIITADICERSNQNDRDIVAVSCMISLDYQTYDKFVITDDDGKNPRTAILTPYFQDKQGRIWKSDWAEDV